MFLDVEMPQFTSVFSRHFPFEMPRRNVDYIFKCIYCGLSKIYMVGSFWSHLSHLKFRVRLQSKWHVLPRRVVRITLLPHVRDWRLRSTPNTQAAIISRSVKSMALLRCCSCTVTDSMSQVENVSPPFHHVVFMYRSCLHFKGHFLLKTCEADWREQSFFRTPNPAYFWWLHLVLQGVEAARQPEFGTSELEHPFKQAADEAAFLILF